MHLCSFNSLLAIVLVLVVSSIHVSHSATVNTGDQVIRMYLQSEQHAAAIRWLMMRHGDELDAWSERPRIPGPLDLHVPVHLLQRTLDHLQLHHIPSRVIISDLHAAIRQHMETNRHAKLESTSNFFSAYQNYTETIKFLQQLQKTYPSLVDLVTVGTSVEGRDIVGIVIGNKTKQANSKPIGIVYTGCQHAREWISPATVCYIANTLLANYSTDASIRQLVDSISWTLFPIVNPDGYTYTQDPNHRMWRKNRQPLPNSKVGCVGVDTNRNWLTKGWGEIGTSNFTCSDAYNGPYPFSEPEESAVVQYIKSIATQQNLMGFIDFHSYGQLVMNPWGYTDALPPDDAAQKKLAQGMVGAMYQLYHQNYTYGNLYTTVYPSSGDSADWTYDSANIKFSYGIELRDTGEYGFLLPPSEIVPQGLEMFAGVQYMGQFILSYTQSLNSNTQQ